MRILVTGATGLVGNNCVRQLVDQDHAVHVLVRAESDPRPLAGMNVRVHQSELRDAMQLRAALPAVDAIIHAAADTHIGGRSRPSQWEVNLHATQAIAEHAREHGARLVFVSSVDALPPGAPDEHVHEETVGEPKVPCGYVQTKRAAEADLWRRIDDGLDAVIVNPGFMLGPWDWKPSSGRMLLQVARRFTPFAPKGGFSVCDVRDVAAAIINTLDGARHRRYILAGRNLRYVEAWRMFARVADRRGPISPAGPLMRIIAGYWGDLTAAVTGTEGDINSASVAMSSLYHYYDSSRARQELDYQVRPIEDSISAAWRWFREYGYV